MIFEKWRKPSSIDPLPHSLNAGVKANQNAAAAQFQWCITEKALKNIIAATAPKNNRRFRPISARVSNDRPVALCIFHTAIPQRTAIIAMIIIAASAWLFLW